MKIIVCIKQVPGTSNVNIDEKTGALIRAGTQSKMNPYDLYALETAARIKNQIEEKNGQGVSIAALTMGPPQAEDVIREALCLGADEGYLLSDRRFAGADVLATSYALSLAINKIGGYELIICGKQTTDGDTAQVGPALAQWLNIPHAAWVSHIAGASEEGLVLEQDLTDFSMTIRMNYKCLITVEKDIYPPRLPSYSMMLKTQDREIHRLNLDDLDGDENLCGLKGSPTQVERIFPPDKNTARIMYEGSGQKLGRDIYSILAENKFL